MIGVQDEDLVHRLGEDLVHLVVFRRDGEAHPQEVVGVTEFIARIHERLADCILEGAGRDRRHLGDHAMRRDLPLFLIMNVGGVVIERRKSADGANHDRHGMRISAEGLEEAVELLVQHRVIGDRAFELGKLGRRGQFTVKQKVADLEEARVLRQLVDRIAAIKENTGVAVDIGDLAFAAGGRGEPGVVGEHIGFCVELSNVHNVGPGRALQNRQLDGLIADLHVGDAARRNLVFHSHPQPCCTANG